jgi:hypothetical protein
MALDEHDSTTPADWQVEAPQIVGARLAPVALRALARTLPAADPGKPSLADIYRPAARLQTAYSMAVEAGSRGALSLLVESDVPFVVIKGPAVARFHDDPTLRMFSDIDVVVPAPHFLRAYNILSSHGYGRSPDSQPPWPWFDRYCYEGINLTGDKTQRIDLHHRIAPWVFGAGVSVDSLIARADDHLVGGIPVKVASEEDCVLLASIHVVNDHWKGDPSLASWRDIILLADRLGPKRMVDLYERHQLGWLVPFIETSLSQLLHRGAGFGMRIPNQTSHDRWMKRRISAFGRVEANWVGRHPAGWALRLPAPRAIVYLCGSAFPSPTYVRTRYGGYRNFWALIPRSLNAAKQGIDYRQGNVADLTKSFELKTRTHDNNHDEHPTRGSGQSASPVATDEANSSFPSSGVAD